jgi:hypothetical protein
VSPATFHPAATTIRKAPLRLAQQRPSPQETRADIASAGGAARASGGVPVRLLKLAPPANVLRRSIVPTRFVDRAIRSHGRRNESFDIFLKTPQQLPISGVTVPPWR